MIYGKHYIQKKASETAGYTNEDGDYIAPEGAWDSRRILCDIVPESGKVNATHYADGIARAYSYVITLDVACPDFKVGEQVLITNQTDTTEKTVVGFQRYSYICKLWV